MSFLSGLLKNIKLGDDDEQKPKIKRIDTDHNWWDATKNAAGDFANGGLLGVGVGAYQRAHQPKPDLPLIGEQPDAKIAGADALTPKPPIPPPDLAALFKGALTPPEQTPIPPPDLAALFKGALTPPEQTPIPPPDLAALFKGALTPPEQTPIPPPPVNPVVGASQVLTPDTNVSHADYADMFRGALADTPGPTTDAAKAYPPNALPDFQGALANVSAPVANVPVPPLPPLSPSQTGESAQKTDSVAEILKGALPPLLESQKTADEMARIEGKKYGFKKDESGKVLRDDKGKPIYEKDRDSDHNWWDVAKSAGLGFAQGGLSGAIGGAVGGAIDRNYDEKAIDEMKLNRLGSKFQNQTAREQAQQGYQMRETQRKNIEVDNARADDALALRKATGERNSLLSQVRKMERYKRGENPEFDAKLEAAHIEQPDFEKDKKILPRFWDGNGNYKIFNEKGGVESVLDEKGQPITDETKATIYVDGYAVKGRDALSAQTAAGVKNTQYGNEDEEAVIKWKNDTNEVNAFNNGVEAKIQAQQKIAKNLELANQELEAEKARLSDKPLLNSEQIKQLNQQINSNKNAWRAANGEVTALSGQKKPLPIKPTPRQRVNTPIVNNVGSYSEAQFRKNFEGKYSSAEIEKLVAAAKQQGIIK